MVSRLNFKYARSFFVYFRIVLIEIIWTWYDRLMSLRDDSHLLMTGLNWFHLRIVWGGEIVWYFVYDIWDNGVVTDGWDIPMTPIRDILNAFRPFSLSIVFQCYFISNTQQKIVYINNNIRFTQYFISLYRVTAIYCANSIVSKKIISFAIAISLISAFVECFHCM